MAVDVNVREANLGQATGDLIVDADGTDRRIAGTVSMQHLNVGALVPRRDGPANGPETRAVGTAGVRGGAPSARRAGPSRPPDALKSDITGEATFDLALPSDRLPLSGTYKVNAGHAQCCRLRGAQPGGEGTHRRTGHPAECERRGVRRPRHRRRHGQDRAAARRWTSRDARPTWICGTCRRQLNVPAVPEQLCSSTTRSRAWQRVLGRRGAARSRRSPARASRRGRRRASASAAVRRAMRRRARSATSTPADRARLQHRRACRRSLHEPRERDLRREGQRRRVAISADARRDRHGGRFGDVRCERFRAWTSRRTSAAATCTVTAIGQFAHLDPAVITGNEKVKGNLNGAVDVETTIRDYAAGVTVDSIDVVGRVNLGSSELGGLAIDTAAIDGTYANRAGELTQLSVAGPDVNVSGQGTIALERYRLVEPDAPRRHAIARPHRRDHRPAAQGRLPSSMRRSPATRASCRRRER